MTEKNSSVLIAMFKVPACQPASSDRELLTRILRVDSFYSHSMLPCHHVNLTLRRNTATTGMRYRGSAVYQ